MRRKIFKKAVVVAMSVMMLGSALTVHAENGVYTVKRGDTLSKIAKEVYGSRDAWRTIYDANKGSIKNANIIYAGQQFVLPDAPAGTAVETVAVTAQNPAEVSGRVSVVEISNGIREGTETVHISNTTPAWNPEYWACEMPAAPAGYEWKQINIVYVPDGEVHLPSSHWDVSELQIAGVEQAITSTRKPGSWTSTTNDESMYDEYSFSINYNGTTYTDCKYFERYIKDLDDVRDDGVCGLQIALLLPKDYTGSVVYTAYGAKSAGGWAFEKKADEAVSFTVQ